MKEYPFVEYENLKNIILVENVDDIICIAERFNSNDYWFRGVSRSDYKLIPQIMRREHRYVVYDARGNKVHGNEILISSGVTYAIPSIITSFEMFKRALISARISNIEHYDNVELLFLAQHYGLPTVLLDWSSDFNIALWFAANKERHGFDNDQFFINCETQQDFEYMNNCCAIYIINPVEFNSYSPDFKNIGTNLVFKDEIILRYLNNERPSFPLAISGKGADCRIVNQKGKFTIHGSFVQAIDENNEYRKILSKILIPYDLRDDILRMLDHKGINQNYIYGKMNDEKEKIAAEIKKDVYDSFENAIKKFRQSRIG